jgi:protein AroM
MQEDSDSRKILVLVIGQMPRDDLTGPLVSLFGRELMKGVGALDGVKFGADLASHDQASDFILTTRMRSGEEVKVTETVIEERLQHLLEHIDLTEVRGCIVMCAGMFSNLRPPRGIPMVLPFRVTERILDALSWTRLVVVSPFEEQGLYAAEKWKGNGRTITVVTGWITDALIASVVAEVAAVHPDAVVLDFVGHSTESVSLLQRAVTVPVVDVGALACKVLKIVI